MFSQTQEDLLYLLAHYLQKKPICQEKIAQMNLEKLYSFSKFHSLSAMVAMILEDSIDLPQDFQESKNQAIRRELLFDHERQKITRWLSQEGIWYMELKGIHLKKYYPKLGMRVMSDNDILFDETFEKEVREFFKKEGYEFIYEINVDAYMKKPIFHFEMHRTLIDPLISSLDKIGKNYYKDIKERLIQDQDNPFAYRFCLEDFYLYQLIHDYKHYSESGTGIRSLVDLFLLLEAEQNKMDWTYIRQELEKIGLTNFEEQHRSLAFKLFGSETVPLKDLTEEEMRVLSYMLSSGTYGLKDNQIINQLENHSGNSLTYWKEQFFPPVERLRLVFPILQKHPYLLPFIYIYRWVPTKKRLQKFSSIVRIMSRKKEK